MKKQCEIAKQNKLRKEKIAEHLRKKILRIEKNKALRKKLIIFRKNFLIKEKALNKKAKNE